MTFDFKHRVVPEEKQIKFSQWNDPSAPKQYWRDIESISFFIGKALDGRLYAFDRHERSFSTIYVTQAKEKFGNPVVYCQLAEPELVTRAWEKSPKFVSGDVPDSFKEERLVADSRLYRSVYARMMQMLPKYYVAIRNGAQYPGLICETKAELDELIESPYYDSSGIDVQDPEKRQLLYAICGFE